MKIFRSIFMFALVAVFASCGANSGGEKHTFEITGGNFVYDGEAISVRSGEMHYPRVPHQYWRHRFQMMRAMGLNAVATYVFWNIHEPAEGVWDFEGDKDIAQFIRTAGEEGLMVILRPGPYVCGEWDFGGYPWWLNTIEDMELRRDNPQFLEHTSKYLAKLYEQVGELQITRGGPIVMVQAENEFGSYMAQRTDISVEEHKIYNAKVVEQLREVGFDVPMFTSDGSWLFHNGAIEGILPTANGEEDVANLKATVGAHHGGVGPFMVAEFYPGWLMHWHEPFPDVAATKVARKTEEFLVNDVSFNYFMVHGGTNFGFMAGANSEPGRDIQPDLTSYDYDAPISEAGWATPKFDSLRAVMQKYSDRQLPDVPKKIETIAIPSIEFSRVADVLAMARRQTPVMAAEPKTFEELGQGYGYVLYSRKFLEPQTVKGELRLAGLRDYATIYTGGEFSGKLDRSFNEYAMPVEISYGEQLDMLVENMGRINYGAVIVEQTKGIVSPVEIGGQTITGGWDMYRLPMDVQPDFSALDPKDVYAASESSFRRLAHRPILYEGTFELKKTGDTFLDMSAWGKGIVFVNGHNLGRYWHLGPQQTLYLPGVWLRKGENSIVVFEQLNETFQPTVSATEIPVLRELRTE